MERTSWDITEIKEKLKTYNQLIERGIVLIYERQTEDEKQCLYSKHDNGIGFNKIDAEILSSFAKQIIRWTPFNSKTNGGCKKKNYEIC